jgi:hypothetical protein
MLLYPPHLAKPLRLVRPRRPGLVIDLRTIRFQPDSLTAHHLVSKLRRVRHHAPCFICYLKLITVKEAAENPFESNDFAESLSNASSLRARVNRQPFESSAYGFNQYGVTTPGGSGHESSHSHSENGMDGAQDLMSFNTFGGATGMSDGMGMEMGYSSNHIGDFNDMGLGGSYGMAAMPGSFTNTMSSNGLSFSAEQEMPTPSKALADDASRLHLNPTHPFAHHGHTLSDTRKKPNPRLQVPSKPSPARRTIDISESQYSIEQEQERMQRTPRGASQSAKQNISQRIEAQKQLDMEDGEKSSEEDSATSEFQGDDDEYV